MCVHKALELLAKRKLAEQNGEAGFADDDFGSVLVTQLDPQVAIEWAYGLTVKNTSALYSWTDRDFKDCRKWMEVALEWKNGMFSPLKRHIIAPEQFFDFVIEKPWAAYDYTTPEGERISGYLGLKGTIDLVVTSHNSYELIDWKTGASRLDWATGEEKTYEKLMTDAQLRLYHYALAHIYPEVENLYVTIFYLQAGGPESLCLTRHDLPETEEMIRQRFDIIRNVVRPKRIYPSWKCNKLCHFGKNSFSGPTDNFKDSICEAVHKDLVQIGLDKVMIKHGRANAYNSYGSGGGKQREE